VASILHISDVHFGPDHQPDRATGLLQMVEERRPDAVILSGDLTQRAKPQQFRQARAFVDRISAPLLAVPGNHDVPFYRFWERLASPLGAYKKHFSPELEPQLRLPGLIAVGINTAFSWTLTRGRVARRRLPQTVSRFADLPPSIFRLAVVHHHLVPPPTHDAPPVAWGAARALHDLSEAGVDLVLAGHLHRSFVAQAVRPSSPRGAPMIVLHAGTATCSRGRAEELGRNTCNWLEIGGMELGITRFEWQAQEGRFVPTSRHSFPRRRPQMPQGPTSDE
jgi:3',5'-cyclic AMP phosphodiesterase CpdA